MSLLVDFLIKNAPFFVDYGASWLKFLYLKRYGNHWRAKSLNKLPDLALAHILLRASGKNLETLTHIFPSVCRRWGNVMPYLWCKVDQIAYSSINEQLQLQILLFDTVFTLIIPDKGSAISKTMDTIVGKCPKRAKLSLCGKILNSINLVLNSGQFSQLTSLQLKLNTPLNTPDADELSNCFQKLENLQELVIIAETDQADVANLFSKSALLACRNTLKNVYFASYRYFLGPEVFQCLRELSHLETLQIFSQEECSFYSDFVSILLQISDKLRTVSLWFPVESKDNELFRHALLQLAKKEISLSFRFPRNLNDLDRIFPVLAEFKCFKKRTRLLNVDLSRNVYAAVLQHMPLKKFEIRYGQNLNDKFLDCFTNGMSQLEKLTIKFLKSDSAKPSNQRFVEFLAKCQRLTKLSLDVALLNGAPIEFVGLFHEKCNIFRSIFGENDFACKLVLRGVAADDDLRNENFSGLKIVFKKRK